MAYHVYSEEVIDCLGGLQDLADKKIRMVSRKIFKKDPVRLIRAYRIGAHLNFRIESQTASTIKADAKLIHNSAGERIRVELFSIARHVQIVRLSFPNGQQRALNRNLSLILPP